MQELIEKLNTEMTEAKNTAVSASITGEELSAFAYRIAVMGLIIDAMEFLNDTHAVLPDDVVPWLMRKPNTLLFLYNLWLFSDYSFVPSLADVLVMETEREMEVSA